MEKCEKFDRKLETWDAYTSRLDLYFKSQAIPADDAHAERRRAMLLQGMGVELYSQFRDFVGGQAALDALQFDDIVSRVQQWVNPTPLEVYKRFRFHTHFQSANESAASYLGELRKIALTCGFEKDKDPKNTRLRDQFVCGMANKDLQKFLLQQQTLTVDKAVQLAQTFETAEKTAKLMGPATTSQAERVDSVSVVSRKMDQEKMKTPAQQLGASNDECYRCGSDRHEAEDCPYKKATCYSCEKIGHISRMCRMKKTSRRGPKATRAKTNGQVAGVVTSSSDERESVDNIRELNAMESTDEVITAPKYLIKLRIKAGDQKRSFGWRRITFELDTGSGATVINRRIWEALGSPALVKPATNFVSYSGHALPVLGQFKVDARFGKQAHKKLPILVFDDDRLPIVGRLWCEKMGLKPKHCCRPKRGFEGRRAHSDQGSAWDLETVGKTAIKDRQKRAQIAIKDQQKRAPLMENQGTFDVGNGGTERKSGRADGGNGGAERKSGRADGGNGRAERKSGRADGGNGGAERKSGRAEVGNYEDDRRSRKADGGSYKVDRRSRKVDTGIGQDNSEEAKLVPKPEAGTQKFWSADPVSRDSKGEGQRKLPWAADNVRKSPRGRAVGLETKVQEQHPGASNSGKGEKARWVAGTKSHQYARTTGSVDDPLGIGECGSELAVKQNSLGSKTEEEMNQWQWLLFLQIYSDTSQESPAVMG